MLELRPNCECCDRDLPPAAAATVVGRYRGSVRWVLRNVLSGGYNRRAYLMWFGGGTGPAL